MPDDIRNPKLSDDPVPEAALPVMPSAEQSTDLAPLSMGRQLAPSLRIMLDERLYEQVKRLAGIMSKDPIFTPRHLVGKAEACFTVITQAVNWNLDPQFVARATYQTPGGSIGFEGKLVQAILEQSGRFVGAPKIQYLGDWSKLAGKFVKATSQKGSEYVKPAWTEKDAAGLGIIIRWQVRGEPEPRVWPSENEPFYLTQCYPLNSPLWATDPKTQIAYLAMRRFANAAAAGILGGMPFDHEELLDASERARDVTPPAQPRPQRSQFAATNEENEPAAVTIEVAGITGEYVEYPTIEGAVEAYRAALDEGEKQRGEAGLTAVWEANTPLMNALLDRRLTDLHQQISEEYGLRRQAAAEKAPPKEEGAKAVVPKSDAPAAEAKPAVADNGKPPRSGIWNDESYLLPVRKLLDGSLDVRSFEADLLFLIGEAETTAELDKLIEDNQGCRDMLSSTVIEEIVAAIDQRRQEIGAGATK